MDNPQAWNRYSYVLNRPVNFNDPTGHCADPLTGLACPGAIEVGLIVLGITVAVWTVAYVTNPDIRSATDQIGQDLVYAAKRWKEKRTWDQGHLIHENKIKAMEADTKKTADDGRAPDDPNWCRNNRVKCAGLISTTILVIATAVYNEIKCGKDECPVEVEKDIDGAQAGKVEENVMAPNLTRWFRPWPARLPRESLKYEYE